MAAPPQARPLFWLKAIYFFGALNNSSWGRFGAIYYVEKGLSATQIGVLECVMPLVASVSIMAWGVAADRCCSKKAVYLGVRVVSTLVLMLLAVPRLARGFWSIFALSMLLKCFVSKGVMDAYTLDVLGDRAPEMYGRVRLYAAGGWGAGALLMGVIDDAMGSFQWNFFVYFVTSALALYLTWAKVPSLSTKERATRSGRSARGARELWAVLCEPWFLLFLLEALCVGMGVGVVERLLFVYLKGSLGASTLLCGLSVFATVLIEMPLFYYSGYFMKRFGRNACMAAAYLAYWTRVLGYTFLTPANVQLVLLCELTHGITFAFLWTAYVETARQLAPEGWQATMQSVVSTAYMSLGTGLGALLGGAAFDHVGARATYRVAAAAMLILFLARAGAAYGDWRRARRHTAVRYGKLPTEDRDWDLSMDDLDDLEEEALEMPRRAAAAR